MKFTNAVEEPRWYAIHTHPQQEERADANIRTLQIDTFAPRLKERHFQRYTGKPFYKTQPLFPRYIFARFACATMLSKVSFTRGVKVVVNFGSGPVAVEDEIIQLIRSRVSEDGCFVRPQENFEPGDKVTFSNGIFRKLTGVFEREVKPKNRVILLLATLSYQGRIEIDSELVQKAV
jgi:transcriptional antiterminator RfaH